MIGLKYFMETNNITPKEIAETTNSLKQQVSYWVNKKRKLPYDKSKLIAIKYNTTPEYLQNDISDEEVIQYYKNIIELEIGKEIEITIKR